MAQTSGRSGVRSPEQHREHHLKYRYGITHDEYLEMLSRQDGRCAICRTGIEDKRLDVDHCHNSDKVRGLLCRRCNLGLGFIEREGFLENALAYLARDGD